MAEGDVRPLIMPLGDRGLLVRFGTVLSDEINRAAVAFARRLRHGLPDGVSEIDPNLVSVLLKFDPAETDFDRLAGEVRLLLSSPEDADPIPPVTHHIAVAFGGSDGPDLAEAATSLGMGESAFIDAHNAAPLRVLTTGFAPGFVYCGFHPEGLRLPRRTVVRSTVPPGSVLFAAGQTAITSTAIPTGWHVIGRTAFRNFDPAADPPTKLREGDTVIFEAAP
ncbi:MAG: allophanate hydrolase subunit 1 [Devosia sp.]|nr:allophanate hydrolase subunit 1 [Devosia sp.]